jgi:hypothetical protein
LQKSRRLWPVLVTLVLALLAGCVTTAETADVESSPVGKALVQQGYHLSKRETVQGTLVWAFYSPPRDGKATFAYATVSEPIGLMEVKDDQLECPIPDVLQPFEGLDPDTQGEVVRAPSLVWKQFHSQLEMYAGQWYDTGEKDGPGGVKWHCHSLKSKALVPHM